MVTRHHTFSRGDRTLPTLLLTPAAAGTFPVVVFGHGLTAEPEDYAVLLRAWAAAGFVVAAPVFPDTNRSTTHLSILDIPNQPGDVSAVLTGLLALPADDPVRQRLSQSRFAVAGHSAGAITALGVLTDDGPDGRDRRFTAAIILAGTLLGAGRQFSDPPVPVLFVHADHDPVVPYRAGKAAYDTVPWPKALLTLAAAEHSEPYVDPGDRWFAEVQDATLAFLRGTMYGDQGALAQLRGLPGVVESGQM